MAITFDWTTATGAYKKLVGHATTAATVLLDDQQTKGLQRGVVLYCNSTATSGTLKVYFIDRDNVDHEVQSQAVTAGTLTVLDFDFHLPRWKVEWTSGGAGSTDIWVEVFPYGAKK